MLSHATLLRAVPWSFFPPVFRTWIFWLTFLPCLTTPRSSRVLSTLRRGPITTTGGATGCSTEIETGRGAGAGGLGRGDTPAARACQKASADEKRSAISSSVALAMACSTWADTSGLSLHAGGR